MKVSIPLISVLLMAACTEPPTEGSQAVSCGLPAQGLGEYVTIPAGIFTKGRAARYREEGPAQAFHVATFDMLAHEVTNTEFAQFVEARGYVSDVERSLANGRPGAGSAVFGRSEHGGAARWRLDPTATWRTPEGEGSDLVGRETHPVVHVSYNDARAYARWRGGRLPSELELEYAASLSLPDAERSESLAYAPDGTPRANTWQGVFPVANTKADGFDATAPVGCYGADRSGAYDLIGNVWEWTSTPFAPGQHTLKGGSFLCAQNFCRRYRPAARQPQDTDFASNHIGFRIVRDTGQPD